MRGAYAAPRFRSERKEIWSAFQPKSDIPLDRALTRSMTTAERTRDLARGNRHFVRVFHMEVVSRYRCALHPPLVAITSGLSLRRFRPAQARSLRKLARSPQCFRVAS